MPLDGTTGEGVVHFSGPLVDVLEVIPLDPLPGYNQMDPRPSDHPMAPPPSLRRKPKKE